MTTTWTQDTGPAEGDWEQPFRYPEISQLSEDFGIEISEFTSSRGITIAEMTAPPGWTQDTGP